MSRIHDEITKYDWGDDTPEHKTTYALIALIEHLEDRGILSETDVDKLLERMWNL